MYLYIPYYLLEITPEAKGMHEPTFREKPEVWLVVVGLREKLKTGSQGMQEGRQSLCPSVCS